VLVEGIKMNSCACLLDPTINTHVCGAGVGRSEMGVFVNRFFILFFIICQL